MKPLGLAGSWWLALLVGAGCASTEFTARELLTGEATGSDTIEGAARRIAEEIAAQLRTAAEEQGWI